MDDLDFPLEEEALEEEQEEEIPAGYKDPFMAQMQKMADGPKGLGQKPRANVSEVRFSDPDSWGDDTPRADGRESVGPDVLPIDYGMSSISGPRDSKNAMAFFENAASGARGDKSRRTSGKSPKSYR